MVILGGGLAGLSLAVRLADPAFARLRVLVVEPRTDYARDRTWSYWRLHGHPFEAAVAHRWTRWALVGRRGAAACASPAYPYETIPADRLYALALGRIGAAGHVELRLGTRALGVRAVGDAAVVETDQGPVVARHAFDTRPPCTAPDALSQRFLGQEVETDRDCFDPGTATIMDFRVGSHGPVHFVYVLPTGPRTALVEDTWFAPPGGVLPCHRAAIASYLRDRHGAGIARVLFEESGAIPMDPALGVGPRRGPVVPLGTPGGAVKPSSGYAFLSIQRQADAVTRALARGGRVSVPAPRPALARWMDGVFLARLRRDPALAPALFHRLFDRCDPEALVRFLGDQARPADYARVVASLPKAAMAATALRHALA